MLVVLCFLLVVRKDRVGHVDLFKESVVAFLDVGMVLLDEFGIGRLDLLLAGVLLNAQHRVQVFIEVHSEEPSAAEKSDSSSS